MTSVPDTHTDPQDDVSEISPELALVDPDLARRLRERGPAPVVEEARAEPRLRLVPHEPPTPVRPTPAPPRPEPSGVAVEPEAEDVATEPAPEADDERVASAEPFDAAPAPAVPAPFADVDDLIVRRVDEVDIPVVLGPDIPPEASAEPQATPVPTIDDLLESLIVPRTADAVGEAARAPADEAILVERHTFRESVQAPEVVAPVAPVAPEVVAPEVVAPEPVVREPEAEPVVVEPLVDVAPVPVVAQPEPVVAEPEPVASPEPAEMAPPPPARERAAARAMAAAPPPPRRRRFRSVVLMSAIASVAAVGILSYLDEASVPDRLRPSWPVADDGTSTATPPRKAPTKPKAPSSKKPARTTPTTPNPKASGKPVRKNGQTTTPTANGQRLSSKKQKPQPASKKPAAAAPEPRRFAWAPAAGALSYHVELFRGNDRVLVTDTKQPVLELGPTWRHEGRLMRLQNGSYRWYVWSVTKHGRDPQAIVQATLSVP
jgi:hypothetical protein